MTPTPIRGFRIPDVLMERIDAARGAQSRTAFVVDALEARLEFSSLCAPRGSDARPRLEDDLVTDTTGSQPTHEVTRSTGPAWGPDSTPPDEPRRPTKAKMVAEAKEKLGLTTAGELARRNVRSRYRTSAEIKAGVRAL